MYSSGLRDYLTKKGDESDREKETRTIEIFVAYRIREFLSQAKIFTLKYFFITIQPYSSSLRIA